MRSTPPEYEVLLPRVEKPGRYIGGEINAVAKGPKDLRAAIAHLELASVVHRLMRRSGAPIARTRPERKPP